MKIIIEQIILKLYHNKIPFNFFFQLELKQRTIENSPLQIQLIFSYNPLLGFGFKKIPFLKKLVNISFHKNILRTQSYKLFSYFTILSWCISNTNKQFSYHETVMLITEMSIVPVILQYYKFYRIDTGQFLPPKRFSAATQK